MRDLKLNTTVLRQALKGWEQHQSGHNLKTQTNRIVPGHTPDFNRFARQVQQHHTIQRLTPLGQIFIGPRLFNSQVLTRYAIFNGAFSPLERIIRLHKRRTDQTEIAREFAPDENFDSAEESSQYYYEPQAETQAGRNLAYAQDDLTANLFEPSSLPPEQSGLTGRLADFKPPVLRSLGETSPDKAEARPQAQPAFGPDRSGEKGATVSEWPRFTQVEPGFPGVNAALEGPEIYPTIARSFAQKREAKPVSEEQSGPSPQRAAPEPSAFTPENQPSATSYAAPFAEPALVSRAAQTADPESGLVFDDSNSEAGPISPLGRALARSQTEENQAGSGEAGLPGHPPETTPPRTALQRVMARAKVAQRLEEGPSAGPVSGPEMSYAQRRPSANSDSQNSTSPTLTTGQNTPSISGLASLATQTSTSQTDQSGPTSQTTSLAQSGVPGSSVTTEPGGSTISLSRQTQPESETLPPISRAALLMGADTTANLAGKLQRLAVETTNSASWVENLPALRYYNIAQAETEEAKLEAGATTAAPFQPSFARTQPARRKMGDAADGSFETGGQLSTNIERLENKTLAAEQTPGLQVQPDPANNSVIARALAEVSAGRLENISQPALTRAIERAILAQEENQASEAYPALSGLFNHPHQLKSQIKAAADKPISGNPALEASEANQEASSIRRAIQRAEFAQEREETAEDGATGYAASSWNERSYITPPLVWRKLGDYQPGEAAFPADNPALFGQKADQAASDSFAEPLELLHPTPGRTRSEQSSPDASEAVGGFVPPSVQAAGALARQIAAQQNWAAELPALAQNPALLPTHLRTTPSPSTSEATASPVNRATQLPLSGQHLTQPVVERIVERVIERNVEGGLGEGATLSEQSVGYSGEDFGVAAPVETSRATEPLTPPTLNKLHPTTWVQRKASDGSSAPASPIGLPHPENLLRSSVGQPLETAIQRTMSQTFNTNFEHVRVHVGDEAGGYVSRMGAEAFTTGPNIFFAPGRYQPQTPEGQALIGHELTHVIQQASLPALGGGRMPETSSEGQTLEREALHNESLILRHLSSPPASNNAGNGANSSASYFDPGSNAVSGYAPLAPQHLRTESAPAAPTQPPLQDVLNNPVVERVIQRVDTATTSTNNQTTSAAPATEGPPGGINMEELIEKVVQRLKRELTIDRERHGIPGNRFY